MDYVRETEVADRLARVLPMVSDRLERLAEGCEANLGLSRVQLQLMDYIYRNGPSCISTLCRALRRAQSSISELTDRLERKGLIVRTSCGDRRKSMVSLTSSGKWWMRTRDSRERDVLVDLISRLDDNRAEDLLGHLVSILDLTEEISPPSRPPSVVLDYSSAGNGCAERRSACKPLQQEPK